MKLSNLVPQSLKPALLPAYRRLRTMRLYQRATMRPRTRDELHAYWRNPGPGSNAPEAYQVGCEARSKFLVGLMLRCLPRESSILELGCNAGRNLAHLRQAGFCKLSGIEINTEAVRLLRETYPELAMAPIYNGPAEWVLPGLAAGDFDGVFTMAVLQHIHPDSAGAVFANLARIAGQVLITVEDETNGPGQSWRHFPRNYRRVFERLGLRQVEATRCDEVEGLGPDFWARVFVKEGAPCTP